jgi:hypothetical protein
MGNRDLPMSQFDRHRSHEARGELALQRAPSSQSIAQVASKHTVHGGPGLRQPMHSIISIDTVINSRAA